MPVRSVRRAALVLLLAQLLIACAPTPVRMDGSWQRETRQLQLALGSSTVDIYWPLTATPAPLVIIAHGFARSRQHMAGWGQHLAANGLVSVVPDLPARADHAANARFLAALLAHVRSDPAFGARVDTERVALLGFSAGGLASLLAAAQSSPEVLIWVGLDPVDRRDLALDAAARFGGQALVVTAEPAACNAYGNAAAIIAALQQVEHVHIPGGSHVDAEWPTSWDGELACGRASTERRAAMAGHVTQALSAALFGASRIDGGAIPQAVPTP